LALSRFGAGEGFIVYYQSMMVENVPVLKAAIEVREYLGSEMLIGVEKYFELIN